MNFFIELYFVLSIPLMDSGEIIESIYTEHDIFSNIKEPLQFKDGCPNLPIKSHISGLPTTQAKHNKPSVNYCSSSMVHSHIYQMWLYCRIWTTKQPRYLELPPLLVWKWIPCYSQWQVNADRIILMWLHVAFLPCKKRNLIILKLRKIELLVKPKLLSNNRSGSV